MSTLAVEKRNVAQEMTPPRWLFRVIFVCFYLSGTAGLIYQVSWMKALGLLFGRTTYAITAVLGAIMAALALGSWLLGRYAERARHPLRLYGWIELGIALTGLGTLAGIWLRQAEFNRNAELRHSMSTHLSVEEPAGLLGYYILNDAAVRQFAAHADLNTDDRTVLEHRTPFNILKETNALNHSIVRSFRQEILPSFVDVDDRNAGLLAAAETQVRLGMLTHPQGAPLVAEALHEATESERTLMLRSALALAQAQPLASLDHLRRAERLAPRSPHVAFMLGQVYLTQGQDQEARKAFEKCLEGSPQHLSALAALVDLETRAGHTARAIEWQRKIIAANSPRLYAEWARLGELFLSAGQTKPALDAFEKALVLEPLSFVAHRRVADLLVQSGKLKEAVEEYRFLIQYNPAESPRLYLELSQLYQRLGDARSARQTLEKAKRIFPASPEIELALWRAAPS